MSAQKGSQEITRFAPSPTGFLHLGHVYAAYFSARHGAMRLRIDDLDRGRCKDSFAKRLIEDLRWLGISWHGAIWRQSQRMDVYRSALQKLREMELLFPCFLSRRERRELFSAPHPPTTLADALPPREQKRRLQAGTVPAWRLRVERALQVAGPLTWTDLAQGRREVVAMEVGEAVLARRDVPASYHLATVIDDAQSGVTLVTRASDLLACCPVQRLLQALLGLPETKWLHHALLSNEKGERLAKRDGALAVAALRANGLRSSQVIDRALDLAAKANLAPRRAEAPAFKAQDG